MTLPRWERRVAEVGCLVVQETPTLPNRVVAAEGSPLRPESCMRGAWRCLAPVSSCLSLGGACSRPQQLLRSPWGPRPAGSRRPLRLGRDPDGAPLAISRGGLRARPGGGDGGRLRGTLHTRLRHRRSRSTRGDTLEPAPLYFLPLQHPPGPIRLSIIWRVLVVTSSVSSPAWIASIHNLRMAMTSRSDFSAVTCS